MRMAADARGRAACWACAVLARQCERFIFCTCFHPFPLANYCASYGSTSATLAGGVAGGLWPDRMLGTPFAKGNFLLCFVASRLLPLSKRERERAPFHVFTNWHSETSFFGYFWTSNSEKTYLINLGDYTNHFWFSKLQNSAVNPNYEQSPFFTTRSRKVHHPKGYTQWTPAIVMV